MVWVMPNELRPKGDPARKGFEETLVKEIMIKYFPSTIPTDVEECMEVMTTAVTPPGVNGRHRLVGVVSVGHRADIIYTQRKNSHPGQAARWLICLLAQTLPWNSPPPAPESGAVTS